jgi:hypothetical protein
LSAIVRKRETQRLNRAGLRQREPRHQLGRLETHQLRRSVHHGVEPSLPSGINACGAASPKEADGWITDKLEALDDPQFCALYLAYDAAFDWSPVHPRLPAVADRTRRWSAGGTAATSLGWRWIPTITRLAGTRLAGTSAGVSPPAWIRLAELMT